VQTTFKTRCRCPCPSRVGRHCTRYMAALLLPFSRLPILMDTLQSYFLRQSTSPLSTYSPAIVLISMVLPV
jgi:hypothetical protein